MTCLRKWLRVRPAQVDKRTVALPAGEQLRLDRLLVAHALLPDTPGRVPRLRPPSGNTLLPSLWL